MVKNIQRRLATHFLLLTISGSDVLSSFSLWRIVFSYVNIFIRNMCLANYGASEAVYP